MKTRRHVGGFLLALFILLTPASAQDIGAIQQALTGTFQGTFRWEGTQEVQRVVLAFGVASMTGDGRLTARGRGLYDVAGVVTTVDIECQIDPNSLLFEMREVNPQGNADFVTDGSHVGSMSPDLRTISTVWTTTATGKRGVMVLTGQAPLPPRR